MLHKYGNGKLISDSHKHITENIFDFMKKFQKLSIIFSKKAFLKPGNLGILNTEALAISTNPFLNFMLH